MSVYWECLSSRPYLTEDKLGKPGIVPFGGRVTVRKSDVLFQVKDFEKANATVPKGNRKMTNNNYGGYADFKRCIT